LDPITLGFFLLRLLDCLRALLGARFRADFCGLLRLFLLRRRDVFKRCCVVFDLHGLSQGLSPVMARRYAMQKGPLLSETSLRETVLLWLL
jgi:hypothetical protein